MSTKRLCDFCASKRGVNRFTMQHRPRTFEADEDLPQPGSDSAGGLDLCMDCWERTGKKRMNRHGHQADRLLSRCDSCNGVQNKPMRYTLKVSARRDDKVVTRGAGGVVLCRACWAKHCQPKTRKKKRDVLRLLGIE